MNSSSSKIFHHHSVVKQRATECILLHLKSRNMSQIKSQFSTLLRNTTDADIGEESSRIFFDQMRGATMTKMLTNRNNSLRKSKRRGGILKLESQGSMESADGDTSFTESTINKVLFASNALQSNVQMCLQ